MGNALNDTTYWECFSGDSINDNLIEYINNTPSSDYINGLVITKNATSPNDTIDVSSGSCYDSTKVKVLTLSSATSKKNSSQAISTTYYIYLIADDDLSDYDILITTSSPTPSLPTGYEYYRLIGDYTTNASGYISEITNLSATSNIKEEPDYAHGVSWSAGTHTAPSDGVVATSVSSGNTFSQQIIINSAEVYRWVTGNSNGAFNACGHARVYAGQSVYISVSGTFYPMKGV